MDPAAGWGRNRGLGNLKGGALSRSPDEVDSAMMGVDFGESEIIVEPGDVSLSQACYVRWREGNS